MRGRGGGGGGWTVCVCVGGSLTVSGGHRNLWLAVSSTRDQPSGVDEIGTWVSHSHTVWLGSLKSGFSGYYIRQKITNI